MACDLLCSLWIIDTNTKCHESLWNSDSTFWNLYLYSFVFALEYAERKQKFIWDTNISNQWLYLVSITMANHAWTNLLNRVIGETSWLHFLLQCVRFEIYLRDKLPRSCNLNGNEMEICSTKWKPMYLSVKDYKNLDGCN